MRECRVCPIVCEQCSASPKRYMQQKKSGQELYVVWLEHDKGSSLLYIKEGRKNAKTKRGTMLDERVGLQEKAAMITMDNVIRQAEERREALGKRAETKKRRDALHFGSSPSKR